MPNLVKSGAGDSHRPECGGDGKAVASREDTGAANRERVQRRLFYDGRPPRLISWRRVPVQAPAASWGQGAQGLRAVGPPGAAQGPPMSRWSEGSLTSQ
jgi:hypothetical protein